MNYYGFDAKQYRSCRGQIAAENWKSARIVNRILLVTMSVFALLSLFDVINRAFVPYYGISLVYTVLVEILFQMPRHKDPDNIREANIDIGSACAGLMFFGIVASIADPHHVATAFLVMQTLVALLLNYTFGHLMLVEFVCMVIFDVSSHMVKTSATAAGDTLNAFSFFLVAAFIAYFLHKERIQPYVEHLEASLPDFSNTGFDRFEEAVADVGRIGGDEFAMLVGGPDPMDRVRKIRDAIRAITLPDGSTITCSIGCARIGGDQSAQVIYKIADDALYEAKKKGRDQICVADAMQR